MPPSARLAAASSSALSGAKGKAGSFRSIACRKTSRRLTCAYSISDSRHLRRHLHEGARPRSIGACSRKRSTAALVGWIHDELIVEAREADVDRVKAILQSEMEQAFIDIFPAATRNNLIEVKVAANWAAVKEKTKAPEELAGLEGGPQ